ncbi:DUF2939 domain-containing protein [Moraxella oblonga]|uniref:DUF2939 domain-containing protein n=1 Tax=Moraxella oblonga TaxID=200413 RepID=UPI00082AABE0|nr:DUF2939 domain-containing protein [Moraxella oblonga]
MKKAPFLLVVVIAVLVVALSPYYKLYTLKTAYEQGDYASMVNSVDFETLRPNLKHQFYEKFDGFVAQNNLDQALSLFGVKPEQIHNYGVRFIDNAVDKAITPDNLTALATGNVNKDSEPLLIGIALVSGAVDVPKLVQSYFRTGNVEQAISEQKQQITKKTTTTNSPKPTFKYCGFNCFAIDTAIKNQPIRIIMTRHQVVDWRIDNVILKD